MYYHLMFPDEYDPLTDPTERCYPLTYMESRLIYSALRSVGGDQEDQLREKLIQIQLKHEANDENFQS